MENMNPSSAFIYDYIKQSIAIKELLLTDSDFHSNLSLVCKVIISAYKSGNKVILAGNGGSAADSQHIAAEFVSRFNFDRDALPALALNTDSSMITAIGNDYGYDKVFSRQLAANSKPGDVFIGISTSGNSSNIISAINIAKEIGVTTIALSGNGGTISSLADFTISVPSVRTSFVQESHIMIGHIICGIVESSLFAEV